MQKTELVSRKRTRGRDVDVDVDVGVDVDVDVDVDMDVDVDVDVDVAVAVDALTGVKGDGEGDVIAAGLEVMIVGAATDACTTDVVVGTTLFFCCNASNRLLC